MAKKERSQVATLIPDQIEQKPEEEILEAEAYASPQPDAGSDVTVLKTVGIGGPVPIVAPKHNTIQLQPIIVPLAVVPYMTQDSGVLRTDGRPAGGTSSHEIDEATEFKSVQKEKSVAKRKKPYARVFALISFILSALLAVPYILAFFEQDLGGMSVAEFDAIGLIKGWISGDIAFSFSPASNILHIVVMVVFMLTTLILLIGLIIGRYPRAFTGIFTFIGSGCLIAVLVIDIVKGRFEASDRVMFLVALALSVLALALAIAFSAVLNRLEDREEYADSEI